MRSWFYKAGLIGLALIVGASPAMAQRRLFPFGKRPPAVERAAPAAGVSSYLPKGPLEDFVIAQFDIRTINSSVNIGREAYQARLMEVGYRPQSRARSTDPVVLNGPNGTITMSLFERGDHNLDSIEDILVCWVDHNAAINQTTRQVLVLQKYSESTPLVALAVGVNDPRCR